MENAGTLIERACQAADHDDFGGDGFREGLDRLLHSLSHEARLNEQGRAGMNFQIVDLLTNRLRVEKWYAEHPETDDREIKRPLIGLGLPRTASTALACMLGEDPATRSLLNWESMAPVPPPDPDAPGKDPRIVKAEAAMEVRAKRNPRLTGMLPSTATTPTECQLLMAHDFKSQLFQAFVNIPSYVDWLFHEADMVPCYTYVKRVFKLLEYHRPGRPWRIKNPSHSLFIDALDEVFPDAVYVMTHRHPVDVVASVADLYFEYHKSFTDSVDMKAIGEETTAFCELAMQRMIAFREAGKEDRFVDIYFNDFQSDPMAEISRLYDFLGEDLTEEARRNMIAWREAKPLSAASYEKTDAALFGLDRDALKQRFAFYAERFGVEEKGRETR